MAKEREYFIHGQTDENGNVIIKGCVRNGIDEQSANKIFDEMAEFAKYAFNKSHAAAYAVVSYRTAYLKAYYKEEFMAATLNSFLGNLDKVPLYVEECRKMGIEILKPDINKSFTRFTVDNGKIRFGLGSIKNVGNSAVDSIVRNRTENGEFKDFSDFCERMQSEAVNKKCIESLIKAGAFDEFEQTRSTLLASYEDILDAISDANKKSFKGQVTMFDLALGNTSEEDSKSQEKLEKLKYNYTVLKEFTEKELLSMEKEMLGLYISGHPLEKLRDKIAEQSNINTLRMREIQSLEQEMNESNEIQEMPRYRDGQAVRIVGIIDSVKKKYTKTNKIMAFVSIEDLYGQCEIIVFENCYQMCSNILTNESIVLIEGRLSIREDEDVKIVANKITEFKDNNLSSNTIKINVTDLDEEQKERLRGLIRFFTGEKNNKILQIQNGEQIQPAGGIYVNEQILKEIEEIVGNENLELDDANNKM